MGRNFFLFLTLFLSSVAWCADLRDVGVFYDVEHPPGSPVIVYLFEIYDLTLPSELEAKILHVSKEEILPSSDPKYGFHPIDGKKMPKKVYLASSEVLRMGDVPGTHILGGNVRGFLDTNFAANNQMVIAYLSRLSPSTRVHLMAATLVRIKLSTGEFVLLPNKGTWNKGRYGDPRGTISPSAIGGVAEADAQKLMTLSGTHPGFEKESGLKLHRKITNGRVDLNLEFKLEFWSKFASWFSTTSDRELDPSRELYEELVHENKIFTEEEWARLGLRSACSSAMGRPSLPPPSSP